MQGHEQVRRKAGVNRNRDVAARMSVGGAVLVGTERQLFGDGSGRWGRNRRAFGEELLLGFSAFFGRYAIVACGRHELQRLPMKMAHARCLVLCTLVIEAIQA